MRLAALLLCLASALLGAPARAAVTIIDDAGRTVTLDTPAARVVLTDGMGFLALALIDPDPVARLAGWNRARLDAPTRAALARALPGLETVPDTGDLAAGGSVEALVALAPDLVVLDPFYDRAPAARRLLEAAGIPVAVLALTPTIRAAEPQEGLIRLGALIGREAEARAYAAFADARLARIRERVAGLPDRPAVLLEAHAGRGPCCVAPGAGEGIGDFIAFAGGDNIAAPVVPGMAGPLAPEYVIERAPEVYIGTGGAYMAAQGELVLGPGVSEAEARASLLGVLDRPALAATPAVARGRVHGLWHALAVSALNVVAVEAMARFIHPDLFADTDPAATLAEIEARFLAAPLPGTLWISP